MTGRLGQVGLVLIGLAALIALAFDLLLLSVDETIAPGVAVTSAFAGLTGEVLVAVLTIRARVFPAWVGLLLATSGVLNVATDLVFEAVDLTVLTGLGELLGVVAIAGYGWTLLRMCQAKVGVQ
jgi:hypothetical protein